MIFWRSISTKGYEQPACSNDFVVTFGEISCKIISMMPLTGNVLAALPLSAPALQREVNHALDNKMTGLVMISFLPGEQLYILVRNGVVLQTYVKDQDGCRLDLEPWGERLQSDRVARLSIQHVPGRRLLFEKLILETDEKNREKKQAVSTGSLPKLFTSIQDRESASLVRIHWQNAEAFVLVPGSGIPLRPAVFLAGSDPELDIFAIEQIEKWREPECDLAIYRGGMENDAWRELHLNVLFEWCCNYLLAQYGYLTGKIMVTSVMQSLLILSSQRGWEISRLGSAVIDQTVFTSPAKAAEAYQETLGLVSEHIRAVIGASLLQSIKRQSLGSMNAFYLGLEKTYSLFSI